jgi:uncharacterized protein with HEPN domain
MTRSPRDRLTDIVQATETIQRRAAGLDVAALAHSEIVRDAVLFQFAVIGEAVRHLPPEIQALAPEIPWAEITATRHYIVHGYWQINYQAMVNTIERDLTLLKIAAARLIDVIENSDS